MAAAAAPTEAERFLKAVITTPEGWFNLLVGPPFHEEWYKWPGDLPKILDRVAAAAKEANVYFSPHLFMQQNSEKVNVIGTRTIAADLDHALVSDLVVAPTVLVETSPGRHQAYWVMRDTLPLDELETLSRQMTYSIADCDHSGWPLGHRFRVPGTFNYKRRTPDVVNVVGSTMRSYTQADLHDYYARKGVDATTKPLDLDWVPKPIEGYSGPQELFEKFRRQLGKTQLYMNTLQGPTDVNGEGRSGALWALMQGLFRVGASRDEVYYLASNSANNKFADNKYHGDDDLRKDVLRAERIFRQSVRSVKDLVASLQRAPGTNAQKRDLISGVVLEDMDKSGDFVVTSGGRAWYLRKDTGRPIIMGKHSDYFESLMETRYGLNPVDGTYHHVLNHLHGFTLERGREAREAVLSYFDGSSVILHGGRQDVWLVTRDSVIKAPDGQYGVLFPWRTDNAFEPGTPLPSEDWAAFMLEGFFSNLTELEPAEATILVRVWVIFCLLRDQAIGRPLLGLIGQQGSGKSTLFRILNTLFYGPQKSVNAVTNAENYDHLVSVDPVVFFDGVDSSIPWLEDKLSLSAAASDLVKRKLYSDSDTVSIRRNALVGISAHNPRFMREDIVDRMIVLNFERLKSFNAETPIIERIVANRNRIWGSIVRDVQATLREPGPRAVDVPQLRVLDFAMIGLRIARAVKQGDTFVSAINKIRAAQTRFNLGEADILVEVVQKWLDDPKRGAGEYTAGQMWEIFRTYDDNFERTYRTPSVFGRKMNTMADSLKTVFNVAYRLDTVTGARHWTITQKGV